VAELSVLPQALPVIAGENDQGAIVAETTPHGAQEASDLGVGKVDLPGVHRGDGGSGGGEDSDLFGIRDGFLQLGTKPLWRIIAPVGIVEMDPHEEPLRGFLQPLESGVDHAIRGPLGGGPDAAPEAHLVVVDVEASREAIAPIEHHRADEGRGREAGRPKALRQGGNLLLEPELHVGVRTVEGRLESRHDRGVGRQGERSRRDRGFEADSLGGDPIQRRRSSELRAVASHVVRAKRVDGDQYDALGLRVEGADGGSLA
jgi:hypothetical protein